MGWLLFRVCSHSRKVRRQAPQKYTSKSLFFMLNNHYTHICLGLDWPDGIRLDKCFSRIIPAAFRVPSGKRRLPSAESFIDGAVCEKSAHRTSGGRELMMDFSALPQPASDCSAEDIALNIVYEDADIIVLNKTVGFGCSSRAWKHVGDFASGAVVSSPAPPFKMVRAGYCAPIGQRHQRPFWRWLKIR